MFRRVNVFTLLAAVGVAVIVGLVAVSLADAQCSSGQCPWSGSTRGPTPAWRYERPVGYRAAVVRIYCQDNAIERSIGSGTLVRWGGKIFVLTARHVIKDVKRIVVKLSTGRSHWARIVKVDAVWDCAVLQLTGTPIGVEAVDVELGDAAMQREGDRLESCGYGPDGQFACNTGLFIGYRRSTNAIEGPDDWMVIINAGSGQQEYAIYQHDFGTNCADAELPLTLDLTYHNFGTLCTGTPSSTIELDIVA